MPRMIKTRVQELAKKLGIKNAYQLQAAMQKKGLACSSPKAYRMWQLDDQVMIHKATLDELCEILGCEPGDLIVRTKRK